jgi:hypothetical protein
MLIYLFYSHIYSNIWWAFLLSDISAHTWPVFQNYTWFIWKNFFPQEHLTFFRNLTLFRINRISSNSVSLVHIFNVFLYSLIVKNNHLIIIKGPRVFQSWWEFKWTILQLLAPGRQHLAVPHIRPRQLCLRVCLNTVHHRHSHRQV